jgi:tetratricopeptide (TPR) repeat protein
MRRAREALSATEKALLLKPDYPAAAANRALCVFALFPAEQALATVKTSLAIAPYNQGLRIVENLACCLTGQLEKCLEGLRELVAEGFQVSCFIRDTAVLLESENRGEEAEILVAVSRLFI